jgi:hypothetical protein
MGVTRKPPEAALNRLIAFLNFAYPERSREKFTQKEVKRRVMPLLSPVTSEVLEFHLARLIGEINRIGLRPHWVITPAEIAVSGLRPGERVLRLQDTRWVLSKVPLSAGQRESVYYDIVRSFEEGDFGRLRICPVCWHFFAAKDFRENICSAGCKKSARTRTAKVRMARLRKRRKLAAKKAEQASQTKQDQEKFQKFREYLGLRNKRQLTEKELKSIADIKNKLPGRGETLKKWDAQQRTGFSLESIWSSLSDEVRAIFGIPARRD